MFFVGPWYTIATAAAAAAAATVFDFVNLPVILVLDDVRPSPPKMNNWELFEQDFLQVGCSLCCAVDSVKAQKKIQSEYNLSCVET